MSNTTTDSVRVVIFNAENPDQFLILAETDDPENWKLPGGKFNSTHETPQAAAERELREELGLDSANASLHQVAELTNDDGVSARYIFAATAGSADVIPSGEIAGTQWVSDTTIPDSPNKGHMQSAVAAARQTA